MILVQVFAHIPRNAGWAKRMAREFDEAAERRGIRSLEAEVRRGSKLTFHLTMPRLRVHDPPQELVWQGRTASVQFSTTVPEDCPLGSLIGTVAVYVDTVPRGHIRFTFIVLAKRDLRFSESRFSSLLPEPLGDSARHYKSAFVSYASEDRSEVLKRVQMLSAIKINIFQDVMSLSPGDRWERELYRHIDECDLFLLFWSSSAKQSKWVIREALYALERQGGKDDQPPTILPIPIEGPPPVRPPKELGDLHFDDPILYFILDPSKR